MDQALFSIGNKWVIKKCFAVVYIFAARIFASSLNIAIFESGHIHLTS